MNTFAEGGGGFKFALVSWTEHIAEGGGVQKSVSRKLQATNTTCDFDFSLLYLACDEI